MNKLYKFTIDCYYGNISGIFQATPEEIELFFGEGVTLYLGEVLGKHYEMCIDLDLDSFTPIDTEGLYDSDLSRFCVGLDPLSHRISTITDELSYDTEEALSQLEDYLEDNYDSHLLGYMTNYYLKMD